MCACVHVIERKGALDLPAVVRDSKPARKSGGGTGKIRVGTRDIQYTILLLIKVLICSHDSPSARIIPEGANGEMPKIAHLCIQKAATHRHLIQSTPFKYQSVAGIESYPSVCPVLCGSLCVLR